MEIALGVSLGYFLWSLLLGGGLSLFYDVLRSGRRIGQSSTLRVNLEDVLFFLLAGGMLFLVAFDKNGGRLRWQGFLGTGIGIGIYYLVFRDRVVHLLVWLYQLILRVFLWIVRVVLLPVRLVYKLLAKPFLVIAWYSKKSMRRVEGIWKVKYRKREHQNKLKKKRKQGGADENFR